MVHVILRIVLRIATALPQTAARKIGRAFGVLWFHVLRLRRRQVEDSLALALDLEPGSRELEHLARANFVHYSLLFIELLRLRRLLHGDIETTVRFVNLDHLDAALEAGKGALVLTAHLGNYDLLAMAVARKGYPVTIVSKPLRNKAVEGVWMEERSASGLKVCLHRNTLREILTALKSNGVVGFVLDQHARLDGVRVDFFGRPASTLRSLAVLAERTGVPVVPIFASRGADGTHLVEVQPALEYEDTGDAEESILHNTQRYTSIIEEAIRRHPDQWTWIHRRWKVEPNG